MSPFSHHVCAIAQVRRYYREREAESINSGRLKAGYVSKEISLEIRVYVDVWYHSHNVAIGLSSGEVLAKDSVSLQCLGAISAS